MTTDADLRMNHEFVAAFESLRKQYGFREMSDAALHEIAQSTGIEFGTLRMARHLRNALAHADPVNRGTLADHHRILVHAVDGRQLPNALQTQSTDARALRAYRVHAWLDSDLENQMIGCALLIWPHFRG